MDLLTYAATTDTSFNRCHLLSLAHGTRGQGGEWELKKRFARQSPEACFLRLCSTELEIWQLPMCCKYWKWCPAPQVRGGCTAKCKIAPQNTQTPRGLGSGKSWIPMDYWAYVEAVELNIVSEGRKKGALGSLAKVSHYDPKLRGGKKKKTQCFNNVDLWWRKPKYW